MKTERNPGSVDNVNTPKKKERKFLKLLLKYKFYSALILIIIVMLFIFSGKIRNLKNDFQNDKQQIVMNYELQLDSLNNDRLLLIGRTFSWAIRSELTRENREQISQFFNEFIKTPGVVKLQLINPLTSVIELSTDKKDEGSIVPRFADLEHQAIRSDSTTSDIITPIAGLNNIIGIFIMQIENLEHTPGSTAEAQ